ncbi:acyl carrier protein [Bradyrhizobium neotropicale]|uniref:Uncharacterized protein n=1 Tax=Bradyrhizobium neotropicale TaxID=1497615 RepID=A0A176ZBP9_9BRAD|nr:acyl carrier protein [Bradyrhizobium neotropicale]OAF18081.1 hypothetical protein AXW67_06095 [Bradyrhizobium neotropicale]
MTREQISDFCVTALANILRISRDRVDTGTKFDRLGLDWAMLVYLMMEFEEKLDLDPMVAFQLHGPISGKAGKTT